MLTYTAAAARSRLAPGAVLPRGAQPLRYASLPGGLVEELERRRGLGPEYNYHIDALWGGGWPPYVNIQPANCTYNQRPGTVIIITKPYINRRHSYVSSG